MERGICPIAAVCMVLLSWSSDPGHAYIGNICQGHVGTIPGNTPAKFEVRIFSRFRTIAFNAQKFMGSRDPGHTHISEAIVRGHVGTIPRNTPAKFEDHTFSSFGADRQTDRNRPIRNDSVVNGYC